jgi:aminoglycoside phosphotransferase family enzyme
VVDERAEQLRVKVEFLKRPSSYPGVTNRVVAVETHFAWVFLTARYAYKLKKPLHRGSLDYRTLRARGWGCRQELRLNRRLARGVYLSVVPLTLRDGRLSLAGSGRVVDWLVRMRRLPARIMLDHTLRRRDLRPSDIEGLVAMLARFYSRTARRPMRGRRYVERLRREVIAHRRTLRWADRNLRRDLVEAAARAQLEFLSRGERLLSLRASRLVDGHGDLRAEHVGLAKPMCVIDALEFDSELRRLDPVDEIAFLALEIERLGGRRPARELVERFCDRRSDPVAAALVHFYQSYRATTRAAIAAWHLGDPQFPDPKPWVAQANARLREAKRHGRLAIDALAAAASVRDVRRPALEQRCERVAVQHARKGGAQQRRNRQDRQPARR